MLTAELIVASPDPGAATPPAGAAVGHLLEREGLPLRGRHVVPSEEEPVARALRDALGGGGLVVGIGEGDGALAIRRALARLLGTRLVLSDRALDALTAAYASRGQAMPGRAEQLALVPQGATVLVAPEPGEPGLLAEFQGTLVAVLPAVPATAASLLRAHVLGRVARPAGEPVTVVRTLRLVGMDAATAEAQLAPILRGQTGVTGQVVDADDELWVRLRIRDGTPAATFSALEPALRGAFGVAWYGSDDDTLERVAGRLLRARGWTVALAESCTGGLVGHRLTQVAGSSAYVDRGFVVYSNAAKEALLGVPAETIRAHGAVSAPCAEAMARGARERAGTDVGLAVTGIAGPDGGTPVKPVGTVFIALADPHGVVVQRHRFDRDREGNKAASATHALDLLRRRCLDAG